jgi:uncharacterized protein
VRIILFSKAPVPGFTKTRLVPAIGAEAAARLARRMLGHAIGEAQRAAVGPVELCVTPDPDDSRWRDFAGLDVQWTSQGDGDLGQRMSRAASRALARGEAVLLIGGDCPSLDAPVLRAAAAALAVHDACLVPTHDGGYVLLGLRRRCEAVFDDMPWSTDVVARLTRERLEAAGLAVALLPTVHDIDGPDDLRHLPAGWKAPPG